MKLFRRIVLLFLLIMIAIVVGVTIYGYNFYKQTISTVPLESRITEIRNDYTFIKKEDLPKNFLNAVVAVEDRRFYNHGPVDFIGILRAVFSNIKNGELKEGGSTITQQVAKNMYYMNEKNVVKRKVAEVFTAIELEKKYNKDDILEIYVNTIYYGDGYHGIKEASNGYLKKEPKDLNLSEATMLAGVFNAPSVYSPTVNKQLCKERQKQVINAMVTEEYITQEEADGIDQSFIDML